MVTEKSVQVFTQDLDFVGSDDWWPVEHQPHWAKYTTSPHDLVRIVKETMIWAVGTQPHCIVDVVLLERESLEGEWHVVLTWRWDPRIPNFAWHIVPPEESGA